MIHGPRWQACQGISKAMPPPCWKAWRSWCLQASPSSSSAAGSVLNWAAQQQGHGRVVQFINLHRLVAVFFNVVGVNEHAWVVPRKD